jgi:hypothetical protein
MTEQMPLPSFVRDMSTPKKYHVRATVSAEITSTRGLRDAIDYVHDELATALSPDVKYKQDYPTRVTDFEIVAVESERAGWLGGSPGPTSEQIG